MPWLRLVAVLVLGSCAGQAQGARDARGASSETCASVVHAGIALHTVQQLERASNALEFESVWQAERPSVAKGTIDHAQLRARIRAKTPEIHACYQAALDRLLAAQGQVVVRFIVDAEGRVPAVSISANDFGEPSVGCCVAKQVAGWSLPPPVGGGFVVVEYPFIVRISK